MFILIALLVALSYCDNWAVLVAGSKGFENFRHQADICQAYQQLKSQGIKEENIIVFMYDDIAHNIQNPHKGSIINYPGGPNVYPGVPHDYTKLHVDPKNFLKVLKGESMSVGSKKTLKSTENDNVFVYFADHGAPGVLAFPIQAFEMLHAKDLIKTIEYMHDHKLYKNLIFYVEACESGSMFNGILKDDMNVYAVTASNPFESSWACQYDKKYDSYLNDCWSGDWMADTRDSIAKGTMSTRTFLEQFDSVHNVSSKSPECAYGDLKLQAKTLIEFQGQGKSAQPPMASILPVVEESKRPPVSSRLMKYDHLLRRREKGDVEAIKLVEEYEKHMKEVDSFWLDFSEHFGVGEYNKYDPADHCYKQESVIDLDCNKEMVELFEQKCGRFDDYSLHYVRVLSQGCIDKQLNSKDVTEYLESRC